MKYKIGDRFFLDGGESVCDEKIEIYKILEPNNLITEEKYLCVIKRDSEADGCFCNIFYEIIDDFILDGCGYEYQGNRFYRTKRT